jgi:hypothetical protein
VPEPAPAEPEIDILPRLVDIPRDSAVDMNAVAARILSAVREWYPGAVAEVDFTGAARLRRMLKPIVATITRRRLSNEAIADVQQAARIVDRTLGLTIADGIDRGQVGPASKGTGPNIRDLTDGDVIGPLYRLADLADEAFDAALTRSRVHGGACSLDSVLWAIDAPVDAIHEPAAEAPPAVPPAPRDVDIRKIVADGLTEIYAAITPFGQLQPGDLDQIDAATAKDYARGLWEALVPVMGLHRDLRARGKDA